MYKTLVFLGIVLIFYSVSITNSGCAQIGMPTGGDKDSLAPLLVKSSPEEFATNVTGNKVNLNFNEYVEVMDVQQNVLVTPVQKNMPEVRYNLKTITVKLKDTLQPNTTYAINFGNSIRDVNEGNVFKEFTYVFSTGNTIDSLKLSGKVLMAETGVGDSTMVAILFRNADDTAVQNRRPDYMTRIKSDGSFEFKYLPAGTFKLYALKDGDGNKFYNSKFETFAFTQNNKDISITADSSSAPTLFAFQQEKAVENLLTGKAPAPKPVLEKKLKYVAQANNQDLLLPLVLNFNNPVKIDSTKFILTDTNFHRISATRTTLDSTRKILSIAAPWLPETNYRLIVEKDAAADSLNNSLAKSDTIRFITKREEDYAKVILRFSGLDLKKHPLLLLLEGTAVKYSYPLAGNEWSDRRFTPGEYGIRILYDENNNGVWDPGNFSKNIQPETTINLKQKLAVKANWDNERDIKLDE